MAGAVQWIKIVVDLFDDEKILFIETLPDADNMIIIWLKLLCLAGKQNNKGVIMFNGKPYSEKMLSVIFRREESVISKSLKTFEEYDMIAIVNGTITIKNWGKHQSLDKIEANKEYMRNYMREYREKQKEVATGETASKPSHKVNGKVNINLPKTETEKELDKEKEIEPDKDDILSSSHDDGQALLNYESIKNSFNSVCKSLPQVVKLTEKRKKSLQAARQILGEVSFELLFEKVEGSEFLIGQKTDWRSDFDWILKPTNLVKILEGNYDNRQTKAAKATEDYSDNSKYEHLKMEG